MAELLIVLDRPQKARNIGAVGRVVAALGAELLVLGTPLERDPYRQALASAGHTVRMQWLAGFDEALQLCRARSMRCVGTSPRASQSLWQAPLDGSLALFFGNEVGGLAAQKLARLDQVLSIPMQAQVESLNLACSVAVLGYEWQRRLLSSVPAR